MLTHVGPKSVNRQLPLPRLHVLVAPFVLLAVLPAEIRLVSHGVHVEIEIAAFVVVAVSFVAVVVGRGRSTMPPPMLTAAVVVVRGGDAAIAPDDVGGGGSAAKESRRRDDAARREDEVEEEHGER